MPFFSFLSALRYGRLFDKAFYLKKYPDLATANVNPLRHYMRYGAAEGRKPHRLFDPAYYLRRNPLARAAANPLAHFLEQGGQNALSPHPLFDSEAYLRANPAAAARGVNPLVHYSIQSRRGRPESSAREGSQFGCAS